MHSCSQLKNGKWAETCSRREIVRKESQLSHNVECETLKCEFSELRVSPRGLNKNISVLLEVVHGFESRREKGLEDMCPSGILDFVATMFGVLGQYYNHH